MSRIGAVLRKGAVQAAIVALGLGLGLGGTALYRARTSSDGPSKTPSVKKFSFTQPDSLPTVGSPPLAVSGPETEPPDAAAALDSFLRAESTGHADAAWTLLDTAAHDRWPTVAAWLAAQQDLHLPVGYQVNAPVGPAGPADAGTPSGSVDLAVDVTRNPSLDPFRGLVAGRSAETWRVRSEDGHWRVGAVPVASRPLLPPDTAAPDAVKGWIDRLSACDQAGAVALQVDATLLGPADVAAAPCQLKGTWMVDGPVTLDRGGDVQPLLAAYGQGAASWARLVPVHSTDRKFWAEVAPVGDAWMVVGVAAGG